MKYKMIFSDFDDTLYSNDMKLAEGTKEAIAAYTAAGGKFVIATGRSFGAIVDFAKDLHTEPYIITEQGANVYSLIEGKNVIAERMSPSVSGALARDYEDRGYYFQVYYEGEVLTRERNDFTDYYEKITTCPVEAYHKPLSEYILRKGEGVNKMLANVNPNETLALISEMTEKYGKELFFCCSKPSFLEAVAIKASKGNMAKRVAEMYGISMEETVGIGDSLNDMSLLSACGKSACPANAREEVKKCVDAVMPSVWDGAVKTLIEKVMNEEEIWKT